jgi:hypothetical protein
MMRRRESKGKESSRYRWGSISGKWVMKRYRSKWVCMGMSDIWRYIIGRNNRGE